MSERKRLFVVSDIHGHYTLVKQALDAAGFDRDDPNHLFVCCGDLFDRGHENRKVYDFVQHLQHKVLIRGNHDDRLVDILTRKQANTYDLYNGTAVTLEEFFGPGSFGEFGDLRLPKHGKMAGKLCRLINGMLNYFETEHYIFVHGWLPTSTGVQPPRLLDNWRDADEAAWRSARFSEWMSLYRLPAARPEKTIVCGHRPTRLASMVDSTRAPSDSSIYYSDGIIAIDAGTIRSGKVNLLVLEDGIL